MPSQPNYIRAPANEPQVMWGTRPARPTPAPQQQPQRSSKGTQQPVDPPAQPPPQGQPPRQDVEGGDESVSEALSKDVFSTYVCRSLQRGIPHPGDIAEASGLRWESPSISTRFICQQGHATCIAVSTPTSGWIQQGSSQVCVAEKRQS